MKKETIKYGTQQIEFELVYVDRKTLGISVHPDLSVEVKAPLTAPKEAIFDKVKKRASWIVEQKRFFLGFEPLRKELLYKAGETHYYLGRQYQLKIEKANKNEVSYFRNHLLVETRDNSPEQVKKLLDAWYRERAKIKFAEYAEPLIERFKKYDVEPKNLFIQQMKYRWGSCSAKGNIILNPELIKAPKTCIEYVIIHELCHLVHHKHNNAFFVLLSREMPDWEKWKNRLEEFMA